MGSVFANLMKTVPIMRNVKMDVASKDANLEMSVNLVFHVRIMFA